MPDQSIKFERYLIERKPFLYRDLTDKAVLSIYENSRQLVTDHLIRMAESETEILNRRSLGHTPSDPSFRVEIGQGDRIDEGTLRPLLELLLSEGYEEAAVRMLEISRRPSVDVTLIENPWQIPDELGEHIA